MMKVLLIGLGGLLGTLGRYWLAGLVGERYGESFPLGTLAVNLVGCFLAGLLFYLMQERLLVNQTLRAIVMIGFLGGFTTFSAYGLQTFTLLRDGQFAFAALNLLVSNALGLLLVWAGYTLAKAF
jgi:CrcB protein